MTAQEIDHRLALDVQARMPLDVEHPALPDDMTDCS